MPIGEESPERDHHGNQRSLLSRIRVSISWRGSITLDIAGPYIPGGVSSHEVEKPSTGASSLFRGYLDRFALKHGTREEAPVLPCCMLDVNPPRNSAEEPGFEHGALSAPASGFLVQSPALCDRWPGLDGAFAEEAPGFRTSHSNPGHRRAEFLRIQLRVPCGLNSCESSYECLVQAG